MATFVTVYTEEAHPEENKDYINYFVNIKKHKWVVVSAAWFCKHSCVL